MVSYFKVVLAIVAVILEILGHVQHAEILAVSSWIHYGYAKCQHKWPLHYWIIIPDHYV